jgi:hypothetical protein
MFMKVQEFGSILFYSEESVSILIIHERPYTVLAQFLDLYIAVKIFLENLNFLL